MSTPTQSRLAAQVGKQMIRTSEKIDGLRRLLALSLTIPALDSKSTELMNEIAATEAELANWRARRRSILGD